MKRFISISPRSNGCNRLATGVCFRFANLRGVSSQPSSPPVSAFDKAFLQTNGTKKAPIASNKERLLVFYDGGCPLCSREIALYDRINRNSTSRIAFINLEHIHPLTNTAGAVQQQSPRHLQQLTEAYTINIPSAYRRLHALREDGSVLTSAHALCEVWERLPYWRVLGVSVKHIPGALPLASKIYEYFSSKRMKWRLSLSSDVACSLETK